MSVNLMPKHASQMSGVRTAKAGFGRHLFIGISGGLRLVALSLVLAAAANAAPKTKPKAKSSEAKNAAPSAATSGDELLAPLASKPSRRPKSKLKSVDSPTPPPLPGAKPAEAPMEPTPFPAAATTQPALRKIEAQGDLPARSLELSEVMQSAETPRPRGGGFVVAARAGIYLPHSALRPGPVFAAEVAYDGLLNLLNQSVRLALGAGYARTSMRGERLVPGRGYDRDFIQNVTFVPVELTASYVVMRGERVRLWLGAGVSAVYGRSEFIAMSATTAESAWAPAFVARAGADLYMGPGLLFFDVRHTQGKLALGPLGDVGVSSLAATAVAAGYAFLF